MITFPNAKINLGLFVLGRRDDGYHDISSCLYPVPWSDALEVIEDEKTDFKSHGLEIPGEAENNLCLKAYELLKSDYELPPLKIRLLKAIPMGAGLGGGSSDGAFMIKLLNDKFNIGLTQETQEEYASKLGSDCPFFVANTPCLVSGTGTTLDPISVDLTGFHICLVNPQIHISTAEAYSNVDYHNAPANYQSILASKDFESWRRSLTNSFEDYAITKHPIIGEIKERFYDEGALFSLMSGSGSTVFGIFDKAPQKSLFEIEKADVFVSLL